jgi:hypothetical protein
VRVTAVSGVLVESEQHDREHAREHPDVLDDELGVRVFDDPAPPQNDGAKLGTNIEAVISHTGAQRWPR